MEKSNEKMCPSVEDSSSSPFPEKLIPIELDVRYRPIQPRRGRPRPATFGGRVQRMLGRLGRLICLSTGRGDGDEDEEYLQYLERTVTYLQSSNRILAARLNSMAERVEVAAKQKQDDAANIKKMRQELKRLSHDNERMKVYGEETACQLENQENSIGQLKLQIAKKEAEVSGLMDSLKEFAREKKEQLTLIDKLKNEAAETRSQATSEVDEAEKSEKQEQLIEAATEQQQQQQQQQQHAAEEAAPRRRRTRRGGVKHRRSKTSHSTQQSTPSDDQTQSEQ